MIRGMASRVLKLEDAAGDAARMAGAFVVLAPWVTWALPAEEREAAWAEAIREHREATGYGGKVVIVPKRGTREEWLARRAAVGV